LWYDLWYDKLYHKSYHKNPLTERALFMGNYSPAHAQRVLFSVTITKLIFHVLWDLRFFPTYLSYIKPLYIEIPISCSGQVPRHSCFFWKRNNMLDRRSFKIFIFFDSTVLARVRAVAVAVAVVSVMVAAMTAAVATAALAEALVGSGGYGGRGRGGSGGRGHGGSRGDNGGSGEWQWQG
jgi:uncharacterized membrane protein YgcG